MKPNPRGARWYGRVTRHPKQVRVQADSVLRDIQRDHRSLTLPEPIVRAAAAEYNRQGYDQSYERLQERGGLGLLEVIGLLADALGIPVDDPALRQHGGTE